MKAEKILVPLDGSPLAEMAVPKALELLSDGPRATLILLRAADAARLPGIDPTQAQAASVREAVSYLAAVAGRLREQGFTRVVRSVWYSRAATAIVEAARARRVDMIVMSTHGRGGARRASRGSVADSVLRGTRTPILLVSADGAVDVGKTPVTTTAAEQPRLSQVMFSAGPLGPARSS